MIIESVYFLNVPRRHDKKFACIGALLARGTPEDCIIPYPAMDAARYSCSEAICASAIADGFSHFEVFLEKGYLENARANGWDIAGKGSLCCLWGMQRMYREIANKGKIAIAMTDKYVLPVRFPRLCQALEFIPKFKIFQLWSWEDKSLVQDIGGERKAVQRMQPYPNPHPEDTLISVGLAGAGDLGLVLSPAGAEMLLGWCADEPYWFVEMVNWQKSWEFPAGCYSINNTDYEVKWGPVILPLTHFSNKPDSERTHVR